MLNFLRAKSEHQRVKDLLSAYLDGELSPEERALVEGHLAECEECSRNLRTLRQTVELLGKLPAVLAPRSFAISPSQSVRRLGWAYTFLKVATASSTVLLAVLLVGDVFLVGRVPAPVAVQKKRPAISKKVEEVTPLPAERERALAVETTPQPIPRPPEAARPWSVIVAVKASALRWAEMALFLSTVALASAAVAIRYKRG